MWPARIPTFRLRSYDFTRRRLCSAHAPRLRRQELRETEGVQYNVDVAGGDDGAAGAGSSPGAGARSARRQQEYQTEAQRLVAVKKAQFKLKIGSIRQSMTDLHHGTLVLRTKHVELRKVTQSAPPPP